MVCDNCVAPHASDQKLYCMLCAMSKGMDDMEFDDEAIHKSKI